MLVSACPAGQAETSISCGYQLSMTRVRIVPVMASSASMVTVGTLGHIGHHIADLAFGSERLCADVDVLLTKHLVHLGQHARQVGVQMGDACRSLTGTGGDLRQVHGEHG